MRKLADYEKLFRSASDKEEALAEIAVEMMGEIGELRKERRASSSDAILAIIKDVTDRWERLCEKVERQGARHSLLKTLRDIGDGKFLYLYLVQKYPHKKIPS